MRLLVIPALVVAMTLSACGGGGGEQTGGETAPPLTKHQLGERMGDVCQEHTDRQVIAIERFDQKHGIPVGPAHEKATNAELEAELVKVILPIVRDNIEDLERELRPAPAQEADFKAFIRALEHGIAYSERDPSWVIDATPEPFAQARALAWKLGTAYCGQA